MKNVTLVLVVLGLVAGLAQAQTLQMRLLWEKQLDNTIGYANGYIKYDEKLGEPRISVSGVWTPPLAFDTLGRPNRFPPLDLPKPQTDSGWAFVSPDGERMIAMRVGVADVSLNDFYWLNGNRHSRLVFFDKQGRLVGRKEIPSATAMKISPYQSRVYVVIGTASKVPERGYMTGLALLCLDRDGRELWRKTTATQYGGEIDCAEDGTLFSMEYDGTGESGNWWGRFYDRDGRVVNQVRIDVPSAGGHAVMSKNGQYVALYFGDKLFHLSRTSSRPLWVSTKYHLLKDFDISPDGQYIAVAAITLTGGPRSELVSARVILLNRKGQEVWRETGGWSNPLFFGRNFFVMSLADTNAERKKFRIYKISY